MKVKKWLCVFLSVILAVSVLPFSASAAGQLPFTDVGTKAWYRSDLEYAYENDLISGTGKTTFEPGGRLTRAMSVTILGRMALAAGGDLSGYRDVPYSKWYYCYVRWASANGIVTGYGDGRFGPDDLVTREQLAAMLARYLQSQGYVLPDAADPPDRFRDEAAVSSYAREGVELMRRTGLISGYSNGEFRPKRTVTRAEAAVIFARLDRALAPLRGEPLCHSLWVGDKEVLTIRVPEAWKGTYNVNTQSPESISFFSRSNLEGGWGGHLVGVSLYADKTWKELPHRKLLKTVLVDGKPYDVVEWYATDVEHDHQNPQRREEYFSMMEGIPSMLAEIAYWGEAEE